MDVHDDSPPNKKIKLSQEKGEDSSSLEKFLWTEKDVGITEYVNKVHPKLFGILKQRYSDFIVHEISLKGDLIKLTSFDVPDHTQAESVIELQSLMSNDDIVKCQELEISTDLSRQVELQVTDSKDTRTLIHKAIRNNFTNLDTRTISPTVIRVFLRGNKGVEVRSRWPKERGDYIKCVLYKENKDTMSAISQLSKMLRVKPSVFQYAGTKDKRAITTQNISVYRIDPSRLSAINGATNTGIKLGNYEYSKVPLKLGDMKGNHFTIILREVSTEGSVNDVMESLRDNGFINYFGMQRFGTSTIPTHHIGKSLLHSNWKEAVDLILKPRPGDPSDIQSIREYYSTSGDIKGSLAMFPTHKHNTIEHQILKGMDRHGPTNILAVLSFLPRNVRLMYVHSYQSYIWNRVVSYRFNISQSPIPGDLVYKSEDRESVIHLTQDTCPLYSIYDIILPLHGYDIVYPNNTVGEELKRLLKEDGIDDSTRHKVKDFALCGSYRNIMIKPSDLQWTLMSYDDVTVPLHQSDMDVLAGKLPPQQTEGNKTALKIELSLPSATYATMALREIINYDTSSRVQSTLS